MKIKSDLFRVKFAALIVKLWKDEELEQKFIEDPLSILNEEGFEIPEGTKVKIYANSENYKYLPLSINADLSQEEQQKAIVELFKSQLPIPSGMEIRFVQSSEKELAIVLPVNPKMDKDLSELELLNYTVQDGCVTTYAYIAQTVAAVTTAEVAAEAWAAAAVDVAAVAVAVVVLI